MTGKHAWAIVLELRGFGLSMADIAERVLCSRQTLYGFRRATRRVSPAIAANLERVLEEEERRARTKGGA